MKLKGSLTTRALLAIMIIFFPILMAFFVNYHKNKVSVVNRTLDNLSVIADTYEGLVYLFLEKLQRRAEDFASDGFIRNQLQEVTHGNKHAINALNEHLAKNKRSLDKTINTIHILSLDGRVVASTNSSEIDKDLSGDPLFTNGEKAVTIAEKCFGHGKLTEIAVSAPIRSRTGGELIGVIVNFVTISELNKILTDEFVTERSAIRQPNKRRWKTMEVYLVNRDKLMITESLSVKDAVLKQEVDTLPVEAGFTSQKEISGFYKNYRGVEVLGASMYIPSLKWVLLAEIEKDEVFAPVVDLLKNALITGAVVVTMLISLLIAFLKKLAHPLRIISKAAQDVARGNFNVVIPVKSHDEIGALCKSFNNMAYNLKIKATTHSRLTAILSATPDFVGIADMDGKIQYLNPAARRMLGVRADEDISDYRIFDAHPEWARTVIREQGIPAAICDGIWSGETALLACDGRDIPVSQVIIAHKDSDGSIKCLSTIMRDITNYKLAEDALRRSESNYRTLLDNLQQKIFYKDRNLLYVSCNKSYASDLKIKPNEIGGKTDYDFYPSELADKYGVDDKRIMEKGRAEDIEEKYVIAGREMTVHTVKTPLRDERGNICGILGIFWDITRFQKAEEEQQRLRGQLYHMQRLESIGTLAGGVAHDFNNLLALIIGYGSLLKKKMGKDDPLKVYVNKILDSSEKAANLTKGLLEFSRKEVTNQKPLRLNELITRVENLLPGLIGENIKLKTVLTSKDCIILANERQIEQTLMNLAVNARDAMPDGGVLTISTDIAVSDDTFIKDAGCGESKTYALITVSDTGVGMDERTRERIFEPFFTTKEVGKGTGIGLSIVYGIVKQHKGYIDVFSKPGEGATFGIYLPTMESAIEPQIPEAAPDPVGGMETILIAEDEPGVMEFTEKVFEE